MFVRGQNKHVRLRRNAFEETYSIAIDLTRTPNPIDLVNRLKEQVRTINERAAARELEELKGSDSYLELDGPSKRRALSAAKKRTERISYRVNKIRLVDYTEEDLMKLIKKIDYEKYSV